MHIRKQALVLGATAAGPRRRRAGPAGTFICVPATAGAAVTSGGTNGTCATGRRRSSAVIPAGSADADQDPAVDLVRAVPRRSRADLLDRQSSRAPDDRRRGANVQAVKSAAPRPPTAPATSSSVRPATSTMRHGSENLVVGLVPVLSGPGTWTAARATTPQRLQQLNRPGNLQQRQPATMGPRSASTAASLWSRTASRSAILPLSCG